MDFEAIIHQSEKVGEKEISRGESNSQFSQTQQSIQAGIAITDEELEKMMKDRPMVENHREVGRTILDISLEEYYKLFEGDNAPYNFS